MPGVAPRFSVILAAGKGTRMRSASLHKVCFPVDGTPAINRAIDIYNSSGIAHHVVVVGALAGQVVETVGNRFENVSFVYQSEQLGTAHAARTAVDSLAYLDGNEDVLLVAGDRIIETSVLEQFYDLYYADSCHMAVLATPVAEGSSQGRIVESSSGCPAAIVEMADIRQRRVLARMLDLLEKNASPGRDELVELMKTGFSPPGRPASDEKLAKAFGPLWERVSEDGNMPPTEELKNMISERKTTFSFTAPDGNRIVLTPDQAEASPCANNSVYLMKLHALRYGLEHLDRNNAQQEEYLSSLVEILNRASTRQEPFRLSIMTVDNANHVMGFNDPAELLAVESHIRSRQSEHATLAPSIWFKSLKEWQTDFRAVADKQENSQLGKELAALYGETREVIEERVGAYTRLLDFAASVIDPAENILIVRSPGRVNVMGRHVDHQGGNCNLMTIGYETLMAIRPRDDDRICLYNVDQERFGSRDFSISELVMDLPWDDWLSLVNSEKLSNMLHNYGGDWSKYIMAAILRIQKKFSESRLRGMDMIVHGNIPMAAGLSSSSSLVVGTAEATVAMNELVTFPNQVVDLCGEGEWFVGTRGGSADHAAVKLGQKGKIIKVRFFGFAVEETVPFPDHLVLVLCDSGIKAQKSANAKDQFNHRICCYRLGFMLIKKLFPQYLPLLSHLRDVNVRNLGIPLAWIYRLLLHLPEQATREELEEMLPGQDLAPLFAGHKPPEDGNYPVRGVVLFGLAEFERSRLYADLLKTQRVDDIGKMMNTSHNGDRVSIYKESGEQIPFTAPTSNIYLLNLIEALESGDPDSVIGAQLQKQPGSYHCSIPEIDRMVDIALRTDGVIGAQLAGAGLGGCMMVLAHRNAAETLIDNLSKSYYQPCNKPPSMHVCRPIAGSGVLLMDPTSDAG